MWSQLRIFIMSPARLLKRPPVLAHFAVVLFVFLVAGVCFAQPITTTPLQACGFGTIKARGSFGGAGTQYSPDGKRILTWGDAGAFLWDRDTGTMLRSFPADSAVLGAAFSPDGTRILTTDTVGRVWIAETGALMWTVNSEGLGPCLFSPNGLVFLAGRTLFDANNGNMLHVLTGPNTGGAASFTSSGDRVAMSGTTTNQVTIYNTGGGAATATLTGHTNRIRAIRFSSDGTKVLTSSDDSTAKLWNAMTGLITKTYQNILPSAEFTPNNTMVAVAVGSPTYACQIYTADSSGFLFRTLTGHTGAIRSAAFSQDGNTLVTSSLDGTARVWNVPAQQTTKVFAGHVGPIGSAMFSPDQFQVLTTSDSSGDQTVRTWDPIIGSELHIYFASPGTTINGAAYSPDDTQILTGRNDNTAKLWDRSSATVIRTFTGHTDIVNAVAFSPDGTQVLTGSSDNTAKLWNASTGSVNFTLNESGQIRTVEFSADGSRALTASTDGNPKFWNTSTGALVQTLTGPGNRAALSPDASKAVISGSDSNAYIRTTDTNSLVLTLTGQNYTILAVAWSPDGNSIVTVPVGGGGAYLELWNAATGELRSSVQVPGYFINSVKYSSDGTRLVTAGNYDARVWDAQTLALIRTVGSHPATLNDAVFSSDGSGIVTTSADGTAREWNSNTSLEQQVLKGHSNATKVALSPDATTLLTADGRDGKIWDSRTGLLLRTLTGHSNTLQCITVSNDGSRVLTGSSDATAKIWDATTGLTLRTFSNGASVTTAAFSPVDNGFATGSGSAVKIWNGSTGALIGTYPAPNTVNAVAYSPDGARIASGGNDNQLRIWNSSTGDVLTTISLPGIVQSVSFSSDGSKVLIGFPVSAAQIYDAASGALTQTFSGTAGYPRFNGDATRVIASNNAITTLWDAGSATQLKLFANGIPITDLAYATTAPLIASTGGGRAVMWELDSPKAVIVAGGGNFSGNGIAQQTNDLAAYAYRTLKARGYGAADIQYLSAFGNRDADSDGFNDVDAGATLTTLQQAVAGSFAAGAGRLLILMIDHGYKTDGFMAFRVNETQTLPSTQLNTWLNDLQTTYSMDVTLIVDCCYSGNIVNDCSTAPLGRKRIVMSSTTKDAEAVFVPSPDLSSFMYTFLGSAYMGNSIGEAWRAGLRFFQTFPIANQIPQISDGSTTTTNADREFFGRSWAYGVQATTNINQFFPVFDEWTSPTVVAPDDPVYLFAKVLSTQDPESVQAIVRTPAPVVVSGDPITSLPRISLTRRSNDSEDPDYRIWETTSTEVFSATGAYTISFSAVFPDNRLSDPVFSSISVAVGADPDQTPIRSILGVGNSTNSGVSAALQALAPHVYGTYLARFADNAGVQHPDWIDYYSAYTDPDRDASASSANVISSIDTLPGDIGRLYVHLIGDSAGAGSVRMDGGNVLSAVSLDSALDALQTRQTCSVILIVDAPYSGAFLNTCKAVGGQQRVVMTSGRSTDQALFLSPPLRTSFSEKILGSGLQGNDLNTAFNSGKNFFKLFKNSIQPQLDDNGSGSYNFFDGTLAKTFYVGRRYAFAGDDGAGLPFILDASTTQTVAPATLVTYNTTLIEGVSPNRVYLQLIPETTSDLTPISQVVEVDLARTAPESWTWSATFNAPVPPGNYILVMYADYPDSAEVKPTEPQFTALVVSGTPTGLPIMDLDGDGFEDSVEFRYGSGALDPSSSPPAGVPYNSTADTDGDGYKDFYEYGLGFDYTDSASHPSLADINGDGTITGADAIILKRIIVGTLQASDYSQANMDMNRDGQVTGADAVILQRFVVQTVTALPTN